MATLQWRLEHKEDLRRYSREWYERNREHVIHTKEEKRKKLKEWFKSMKETLKCEKCSQSHIACLQFHHIDPKEKDMNVSYAVHNGWNKERILKEIKKCIVLCANCHAILHWEE